MELLWLVRWGLVVEHRLSKIAPSVVSLLACGRLGGICLLLQTMAKWFGRLQ